MNLEYETGLKIEGGLATLPNHGKAIIIGDLHSKLENLEKILKETDFEKQADKKDLFLVFLGDYADRPDKKLEEQPGWETLERVFDLKNRFKGRVVTIAGNHELVDQNGQINIKYAPVSDVNNGRDDRLFSELKFNFGEAKGSEMSENVKELYETLPIAVKAGRVLMAHGGIPITAYKVEDYKNPSFDLKLQTVWNEPKDVEKYKESSRGQGIWHLGKGAFKQFFEKNNLDAFIGGHTHKNDNFWNMAYTVDSSGVHGANPSYLELDLKGLEEKSAVHAKLRRFNLEKTENPLIKDIESIEKEMQEEKNAKERENVEKPVFYLKSAIIEKNSKFEVEQQTHELTKEDMENGITLGRFSHHLMQNEGYKPVTGEGVEDYFKIGNVSREHVVLKLENGMLHFTHKGSESPSRVLTSKGEIALKKGGVKECFINPEDFNGLILGEGKHAVKISISNKRNEREEGMKNMAQTSANIRKPWWKRLT